MQKWNIESILYSNFDKEEYSSEKLRLYHRILDVLDVKYGINPELVLTELYCDTYIVIVSLAYALGFRGVDPDIKFS